MNFLNVMPGWLKIILLVALTLLVGFAFGRYLTPTKLKIKTKVITHTVYINHNNIVTITHTVKEPNGTIITNTKTTDKSTQTQIGVSKENNSITRTASKPNWKIEGLAGLKWGSSGPVYGIGVSKRILGPIFVGGWGLSDKTVGVSVGIDF